jgi:hypothetical protein
MSTLSEKVDPRTTARYEAVLGETATALLAKSERVDRQPNLDRDAELTITSSELSERRSVRNVGEAIRWLARVAMAIGRWTYERVALSAYATVTADNVVTFGAGDHGACSCEPNGYQAVLTARHRAGCDGQSFW